MDEIGLSNVVMATVAQVTQRRFAYVHSTSDFTADVGVKGGASHQEKTNIAALLPLQVVFTIHEADDEARPLP